MARVGGKGMIVLREAIHTIAFCLTSWFFFCPLPVGNPLIPNAVIFSLYAKCMYHSKNP